MSEASIAARAKAREKVERLTRKPKGDVDASGWREPLGEQGMAPGVQTGPRPVSRRQFRHGGKVHGSAARIHAGRKPRASGGMTANEYMNRNIKDANESREGPKHLGGMKKGGRAHKTAGGSLPAKNLAQSAMKMVAKKGADPYNSQPSQAKAYDQLWNMRGGRPAKATGGKAHGGDCRCEKCGGGSVGKAAGGPVSYGGSRPEGGRIARKGGGRAKKGMNVNIIIAPSGPNPAAGAPPMMPPPGGPIGMHQGAPPPLPMMPPAGGGSPVGGPPPMMRKSGGRAYPISTASAGGLGRLEKRKAYGGKPIDGASPIPP